MIPRWGFFVMIASAVVGCGPDPAKQAVLEQLVTTRSAITVGVTQKMLSDREIALRTAAELAKDRLTDSQRGAVAAAIDAISKARIPHASAELWELQVGPLLDTCATRLDTAIASLR